MGNVLFKMGFHLVIVLEQAMKEIIVKYQKMIVKHYLVFKEYVLN